MPLTTALWLGHSTFLSSAQASPMKWKKPDPGAWRSSELGGLRAGGFLLR